MGLELERSSTALAFTSLAALAEIAVAVFGNGLEDLGRHLVTAAFYADATLGLAVLQLAVGRHRPRTEPALTA